MKLDTFLAYGFLACGAIAFLVGLIIYRDNPRDRINRSTALMLFFGALGPVLGGFETISHLLMPERATDGPSLVTDFAYLWELFFPSLLFFALVFPRESQFCKRHPRCTALIFVPHLFHVLIVVTHAEKFFARWNVAKLLAGLPQPLEPLLGGIQKLLVLLLKAHAPLFSLVNLLYVVAAIALLVSSYRHVEGERLKGQVRVIVLGLGSCVGIYALGVLIPGVLALDQPPRVRAGLVSLALAAGSGSIGLAVVKYSFLNVRLILRRGLLYSLASSVVILVSLVALKSVDRLATGALGGETILFETVFVVVAVFLFQPILGRMEELIDRILASDPRDYRNLIRQLSGEIVGILDLDHLRSYVVRSLGEALQASSVILILKLDGSVKVDTYGESGVTPSSLTVSALLATARSLHEPATPGKLTWGIRGQWGEDEVVSLVQDAGVACGVPVRRRGGRLALEASAGQETRSESSEEDESDVLGMLLVGKRLAGGRYRLEDMTLLSVFANYLAIGVENAVLHKEELERLRLREELSYAQQIQTTLLPKQCPSISGLEISAHSSASKYVGGDFYDYAELIGGRLRVVIGDVSGTGVPAALLMAMLQAGVRSHHEGMTTTAQLVRQLNMLMYQATTPEKFATFFCGELDISQMVMRYCNAGHEQPLLVRLDGELVRLSRGGLMLGVLEKVSYVEDQLPLRPGDTLVLYTDGLTEAANGSGEHFGEERLLEVLVSMERESSERVKDAILERARAFTGGGELEDDIALVVVRVTTDREDR